jgi:hypothetical protein
MKKMLLAVVLVLSACTEVQMTEPVIESPNTFVADKARQDSLASPSGYIRLPFCQCPPDYTK